MAKKNHKELTTGKTVYIFKENLDEAWMEQDDHSGQKMLFWDSSGLEN